MWGSWDRTGISIVTAGTNFFAETGWLRWRKRSDQCPSGWSTSNCQVRICLILTKAEEVDCLETGSLLCNGVCIVGIKELEDDLGLCIRIDGRPSRGRELNSMLMGKMPANTVGPGTA